MKFSMGSIYWKIYFSQIKQNVFNNFKRMKICLLSLFYNDFIDGYYIGDALMEPMFWFVDHFTKVLGPICVVAVFILTSSLIVIAYVIGLPFYLQRNYYILTIGFILGHWILINVVFYYYMAFVTPPGYPPQGAMVAEAVSICKRCIAPKPPRTHHCTVCNKCILKMDHHCPWLNNCIGHFNHRYFFMFCSYSWIGTVFLIIFGIPIIYDHFIVSSDTYIQDNSAYVNSVQDSNQWLSSFHHSCIVYATLLCVAVLLVLGALISYHVRLITNGETSIERHINKSERKRLEKENQVYKNPYNFGAWNNWKLFLCFNQQMSWLQLARPYKKKPYGDGIHWKFKTLELNEEKKMEINEM